jgi:hypothetical protein
MLGTHAARLPLALVWTPKKVGTDGIRVTHPTAPQGFIPDVINFHRPLKMVGSDRLRPDEASLWA